MTWFSPNHSSAPAVGASQLNELYVVAVFYISLILIFIRVNGEPISVSGIALSNLFVAAFVAPMLVSSSFYENFPQYALLPLSMLICLAVLQLLEGQGSSTFFAVQSFLFFIFPFAIIKYGLLRRFIIFGFTFIASSQIYLLLNHGGSLPVGELGGFYVSRRTIHSLSLGFFAILIATLLPGGRRRLIFFIVIFLALLISQARGAAILFGLTMLFGQNSGFSLRGRLLALVLGAIAVLASIRLSPNLLLHFQALTSVNGGSSTGYRAYLLQILVIEFDRYWLFGMPDTDVQYILANRFTAGRQDTTFALDNSFVHFALKYGGLVLLFLMLTAIRLIRTLQPIAIYFVGWLFLDDILGNGLGWLFLGTALGLTSQLRRT